MKWPYMEGVHAPRELPLGRTKSELGQLHLCGDVLSGDSLPFPALGLDLGHLTASGTLHFGKLRLGLYPLLPKIFWGPNANFIIPSPTHFNPASVISLTNTQIIVSSYHTLCHILLGIGRSKAKNMFTDFTSFSHYCFPNNASFYLLAVNKSNLLATKTIVFIFSRYNTASRACFEFL